MISANEVKKRGVSIFDEILEQFNEVVINFRGKKKYVVIDYERYKALRALELDRAYEEVMKDVQNGEYHTDIEKHLQKIMNV